MVVIPAVTKFSCLQDLCLFVTPYSYVMYVFFNTRKTFENILNEVIKTPLPLYNHISHESSLMLWMAMWESSLSVQTKWLITLFCIDTVIIITLAMMEIIKAPLLSWFCGFVLSAIFSMSAVSSHHWRYALGNYPMLWREQGGSETKRQLVFFFWLFF